MADEYYQSACLAGDPAAHVAALSASELARLHHYAAARQGENSSKGGIPATIKWLCVVEAATRFFKSHATHP